MKRDEKAIRLWEYV